MSKLVKLITVLPELGQNGIYGVRAAIVSPELLPGACECCFILSEVFQVGFGFFSWPELFFNL